MSGDDEDIDQVWKREFEKMKSSTNNNNNNNFVNNLTNLSIDNNSVDNDKEDKEDDIKLPDNMTFGGLDLNDPKIPPFIKKYLMEQLKSRMKGSNENGNEEEIEDKRDGKHSKTKGAAPCGRKHWFQGREVDYVANIKGLFIGWDKDENTITVAERFIDDNKLNEGLIDDTPLVNQISEALLKTINHDDGLKKKKEPESTFDPYKAMIHGPKGGIVRQKDSKTGEMKFVSVVTPESFGTDYKGFDEKFLQQVEQKKKRVEEENERKYKEFQMLQEGEYMKKKEIEERIKMNQLERNRDDEVYNNLYEKKPSNTKKIIKDGNVEYVEDDGSSSHQVQDSPKKTKFANLSDLSDMEEEDQPFKLSMDPFKKEKKEWQMGDVIHVIEKYGSSKAKDLMLEHGFSEEEVLKGLYFYLMSKQKQMRMENGTGNDESDDEEDQRERKKKSSFYGSGFSLKSSPVENEDEKEDVIVENINFDEIPDLTVDQKSPITKLRIRFSTGTTETVTFNLSHTVGDIRSFVVKKSSTDPCRFNLIVNNQVLGVEKDSRTLEEEKLKNCVIVQSNK